MYARIAVQKRAVIGTLNPGKALICNKSAEKQDADHKTEKRIPMNIRFFA
jgi:hypothetical protein